MKKLFSTPLGYGLQVTQGVALVVGVVVVGVLALFGFKKKGCKVIKK